MPSNALSRTRLAVAAAFFAQGFTFISLTTRLPQLMGRHEIGALGQSLVMLTIVVLAGGGSLVAERGSAHRESAVSLRLGLACIAIGAAAITLAPSIALLVPGLAVYGLGLGLVDAASNMQAVAVEARYGRPILPSFHGAWTLGGVVAAAVALMTARLPLGWTAAVAIIPLAIAAAPFLRRTEPSGQPQSDRSIPVPWRSIGVIGVALVVFYMVDTAATTWGPTYLDQTVGAPQQLVALATLPYLLATGAARIVGDAAVHRFGPVRILRLGAVVACAALAVIVVAQSWQVAALGFCLLGLGVAVVAPLSFSAAARIAGGEDGTAAHQARVDAVVARFNQFNYVGALLGAVMTGVIGAADLRWGFAVPMVLVLALVPLAPRFAAEQRAPATS